MLQTNLDALLFCSNLRHGKLQWVSEYGPKNFRRATRDTKVATKKSLLRSIIRDVLDCDFVTFALPVYPIYLKHIVSPVTRS
jgi:hypothetical protein